MIYKTYDTLLKHYDSQNWWPADTPFEIMVGAILTQNTSWQNVTKAINQLKQYPGNNPLNPQLMYAMTQETLADLIRPSGFYTIKAKRLHNFLEWFNSKDFDISNLLPIDTQTLRAELLSINGVGKETADSILLYALDRPIFVIDAYTRRIFERLGLQIPKNYDEFQSIFEQSLEHNPKLYNEYHALIVRHAKEYCKTKPLCNNCFIQYCQAKRK
ncbi:endonuclease III domain-containing protein [Desulfuribacillus alkaliarsenatis]|uniref:Endonuclease n=1 Tax=Desulfuribacillus alkaliarsenatis TaxID=766136 RepID=A0A1E5G384_9FIRM|nr:endonuclease III domain-containing protein [Desulfuribacillus alkaliarsenatis]OEF97518.1 endonuclease [Desulfuribacillus alkaliarsenatis]